MISDKEKQESLDIAKSESLKIDMRFLKRNRPNPVLKNGTVDIGSLIDFLNAYNEFINHKQKPFKPIKDHSMLLQIIKK